MPLAAAAALALAVLAVLALALWRRADLRADAAEARRLLALCPAAPGRFDPAMVAGLPEAARRFLTFAIRPGTPLRTCAAFEMRGRFGPGTAANPGYMAMAARQVLAAPHGFVWAMRARRGAMLLSGSDSGGWTRFWIGGLIPVARQGGDADHRRSAFGRFVAEAVFWTPAAVLPGPGVHWEGIDADRARVTLARDGLSQAVDLRVAADGQLTEVVFARWTNANPGRVWREQPFGGRLSDWREVQGFRVPFHVEAGNFWGTPEAFVFYAVDLLDLRFPGPGPGA